MSTDIREGDLLKFTNRKHPEATFTSRALTAPYAGQSVLTSGVFGKIRVAEWDVEVLDRPLPPISDELLHGAVNAFREARGFTAYGPTTAAHVSGVIYSEPTVAIINFVRKYDAEHDNKESAK